MSLVDGEVTTGEVRQRTLGNLADDLRYGWGSEGAAAEALR